MKAILTALFTSAIIPLCATGALTAARHEIRRVANETELKNLILCKLVYFVTNKFHFTRARYYSRVGNVQSKSPQF